MGSFSVKCVVTGQVITPGSKCRIAFIKPRVSHGRIITRDNVKTLVESQHVENCEFNAFYSLMTTFMPGTYDDFGVFKLSLNPMTCASLMRIFETLALHGLEAESENERAAPFNFNKLLQEKAPKLSALFNTRKQSMERFHGHQLDSAEAQVLFDAIQAAVQDNMVFFSVASSNWRQLKLSVMHEETYQELLSSSESQPGKARRDFMAAALKSIQSKLDVDESDPDAPWQKELQAKQLLEHHLSMNLPCDLVFPMLYALRQRMFMIRKTIALGTATYQTLCDDLPDALDEAYAMRKLYSLDVQLMPVVTCRLDLGNLCGKEYAQFVSDVSERIVNP